MIMWKFSPEPDIAIALSPCSSLCLSFCLVLYPFCRILCLVQVLVLGCVNPLAVNNVERFAIDAARINIYISAG